MKLSRLSKESAILFEVEVALVEIGYVILSFVAQTCLTLYEKPL